MVRVPFFVGGVLLKNKLKIYMVICFCLLTSFDSFASDKPTFEPGTKDEKGCFNSGMLISYDEVSGNANRFTMTGTNLYCVISDNSLSIYGENGLITHEWLNTSSNIWNVSTKDGPLVKNQPFTISPRYNVYGSIPVFDSSKADCESSIKKYLENGDTSGAENKYDISQPTQDNSVELPKNLRTYGNVFEEAIEGVGISSMTPRYNAMTVRWDPPEDIQSYAYDVKIQVTYSICTGVVTGRVPDLTKTETTSAEMVVTDYPYANRGTYDLTTGKEISRGDNQPEDYVINGDTLKKLNYSVDFNNMFPRSLKVWVRNRKGNKCSNWVAVSANASMPSGSNSKARVEDDNGNKVDNNTYNDTPVDNSKQNTYYETDKNGPNSTETPEFSLSKFLEYLKSGFGLMGSNGLFAFFSRSFNYIPSQIWSLITAGVACMIVVGIINFALKR